MKTFFDHIRQNKVKSWFLLSLFALVLIGFGYVLGLFIFHEAYVGVFIMFVFSIFYLLIGYYSGDKFILRASRAVRVTKKQDPFLINTVEGLAIAAGIPVPGVYMIKEDSINAFATGRDPKHASITVTSGARKSLNRTELEGVIAHEMSHIRNYDIRFMMLVSVFVAVILLFSDFVLRRSIWMPRRDDGRGNNAIIIVIAIACAILAPLIAQLIRFAMSRSREFLADASGAQLTRYPHGLANALKKIRDCKDTVVDTANKATAHLYIENPLRNLKGNYDEIFSTHPNINERIKRLEGM